MKVPALIEISTSPDLTLHTTFEDGTKGVINFSSKELNGVLIKLKDPTFFNEASLRNGVLYWPEEIGICGDSLYLELKGLTFDAWRKKQLINA